MLHSAISKNTSLTYQTALNAFNEFQKIYHLRESLPIPSHDVVLFIAYCFEKGLAAKTISTYIAGLNYLHKLHDFYNLTDNFIIKKVLEGYQRKRRSDDIRAPITYKILESILQTLPIICFDSFEMVLFQALYTLAYFGLMRVSEIVDNVNKPIQLHDVKFENNYLLVTLRRFKTNQKGPPVTLKLPKESNANICPFTSLLRYSEIRPPFKGNFFCHKNGRPVTRYQFSAVLKKCTARLPVFRIYKSHSFRKGRASDLFLEHKVSLEKLMMLARWKSPSSYKTYIRL